MDHDTIRSVAKAKTNEMIFLSKEENVIIKEYTNEINILKTRNSFQYNSLYALLCKDMYKKANLERTLKMEDDSNKRSILRARSKCRDMVKLNDFTHFITLTFDVTKTDSSDKVLVKKRLFNYCDNLVRKNIGYVMTLEYHEKDRKLHAHLLVTNYKEEYIKRVKAKHYYHDNCKYWHWGFSKVKKVTDEKIAGYIMKYIGKGSNFLGRYYYSSNNLIKEPVIHRRTTDEIIQSNKVKSTWYWKGE